MQDFFLGCLTLEDGTDRLYGDVGKKETTIVCYTKSQKSADLT